MTFSTAKRKEIHLKYRGRCAYCGITITQKQMQVDHIVPKIRGGTDEDSNLNPACHACNNYKLFFDLETFRKKLEDQVELAMKYSVNFRLADRYGLVTATGNRVKFYFERYARLMSRKRYRKKKKLTDRPGPG